MSFRTKDDNYIYCSEISTLTTAIELFPDYLQWSIEDQSKMPFKRQCGICGEKEEEEKKEMSQNYTLRGKKKDHQVDRLVYNSY